MPPVHGVLVVDKPSGPTSHDVVDRVRNALAVRKAGHTGTLDPFATGVLAVCLGKATRLARFLAEGEKVYRASVRLGFSTTTDDVLGEPLAPAVQASATPEEVRAACDALTGPQLQLPPAFSAKRIDGRRAYDVARAGGVPQLAAAPVTVHRIEVLAVAGQQVELEVSCSRGTYIRALARDLGRRLGLGGHLAALRRTRSGPFDVTSAVTLDAISGTAARVLPLSALLPELPAVTLGPDGVTALRHGRDLSQRLTVAGFPASPGRVRLLTEGGELLALGMLKGLDAGLPGIPAAPVIHPDVVLIGPDAPTSA